MNQPSTYRVELRHPSWNVLQCDKNITVHINDDGTRYCTADGLGCSRNYVADCDSQAIRQFAAEHGVNNLTVHLPNGRTITPSAR